MPNFDQKLFFFPESYNRLREELYTYWNPREKGYQPWNWICKVEWTHGQCNWAMAFDADLFVEYMNTHLNGIYNVQVVSDREMQIGHICSVFLKELRRIRGEPNP